jgi:CRP-like cAMP-binding protein
MQESFFIKLQLLPLFQGVSHDELMHMVERVKFSFVSAEEGEIVVESGTSANKLLYALSGTLTSKRVVEHGMIVEEYLEAPFLFHPECMFGRNPCWKYTLKAQTDASLLSISKHDVLIHLLDFLTFRLSLLNYLSSISEEIKYQNAKLQRQSNEYLLINYLLRNVSMPYGTKSFKIGMVDLSQTLGISRLALSKCLNNFSQQGYITLKRGGFVVKDFALLLQYLKGG